MRMRAAQDPCRTIGIDAVDVGRLGKVDGVTLNTHGLSDITACCPLGMVNDLVAPEGREVMARLSNYLVCRELKDFRGADGSDAAINRWIHGREGVRKQVIVVIHEGYVRLRSHGIASGSTTANVTYFTCQDMHVNAERGLTARLKDRRQALV